MTTPAQPWTDPADLLAELADIDALTAEVFGGDVPLRDRVAALVADWQDSDEALACCRDTAMTEARAFAVGRRIYQRHGIA